MLLRDFRETKKVQKVLKAKKTKNANFCELCLSVNPDTDGGYTECCNERLIWGEEALENAKQDDVLRYLQSKYEASSNGTGSFRKFVLENKNKEFSIYLKGSIENILIDVNRETKGLRKEF